MTIRILVVNCNTNAAMTEAIAAIARSAAAEDTMIIPVTPSFGPESAEGYYESFISAAAVLSAVESIDERFDAIVTAGFGEHGREGLRQRWSAPVVDITEAAPILANLVSHQFGVVTTLASTLPGIWDSLRSAGLASRCTGVRASGIAVSTIHGDLAEVADSLVIEARELLEQGADAIVLGCAGFAGLDARLRAVLGVPVIDGVDSAVRLAETLVRAKLSTSKVGPYKAPDSDKAWLNWPFVPTADRLTI
jgi:allantoin racemase